MGKFKNIYGKEFEFRTIDKDFISVLSGGYAIAPDGQFIDVLDEEDHSNIFSDFLYRYLDSPKKEVLDTLESSRKLTELGFVVYLGIKTTDMKEVAKNYGSLDGYSILFLPEDYENLPDIQKDSCDALMKTNRSLFGNYERVNVSFHVFSSPLELPKQDVLDSFQFKDNTNSIRK